MNRAFNHGSQGDFFGSIDKETDADTNTNKVISNAPLGTGQLIRDAARDGQLETLTNHVEKWKLDSVINEADGIGTTALHSAASNGHKACVEILLQCGADKTIKNNYGQTAYVKAKGNDIKQLIRITGYKKDEPSCIIA